MRLILFLFIVGLIQCKSDQTNPEVDKLYKEVMIVHDEVMPETATIHNLKKSIKALSEIDSFGLALILELDAADEDMMGWMADFSKYKEITDSSDSVKIEYLKTEIEKISDVSKGMKSSIARTKKYLASKQ